ncbi:MAG TPA: type II secretion system protein GspJ [Verrucomicrobiae bacterium]
MRPHNPSRAARAFTLVEILVAMGILSLVLTAIYSSWTAILRASKAGLNAAAAVQRARVAGRTIEESLGSAMCYTINERYYGFVAENGEKASLSFVARLSPSFPRHGKFEGMEVRRVTFSVEQGRDGSRQLVLRQCPVLMEPDVDEKQYPLVLATHVKEFKLEFWDKRTEDWLEEWKLTNSLPPMVKVTLELGEKTYSSRQNERVMRIVSLPAMAVAPLWQMPRLPNMPGMPGGTGVPPGGAGTPPGGVGIPPGGLRQ